MFILNPASYEVSRVDKITPSMKKNGILEISKDKYREIKKIQREGVLYTDDIPCILKMKQQGEHVVIHIRQEELGINKALLSIVVTKKNMAWLMDSVETNTYEKPVNVFVSTFTILNRELRKFYHRMREK